MRLCEVIITKDQYVEKAQEIWNQLDDTYKHKVRTGGFPSELMIKAEYEGFNGTELRQTLQSVAES